MPHYLKTMFFWQSLLVWVLFIASIGALLFNSVTAYRQPTRELASRRQLREASSRLALAGKDLLAALPSRFSSISEEENALMATKTREVLQNFPEVEGGFYIDAGHDLFAGFAFPGEHHPGPHPHSHSHPKARRDPPPREAPYIRLQAQQSAQSDDDDPLIQSRDVGPSRILVATAPVGTDRPALFVVWLMYRVTGPEDQRAAAIRYQVSTALALGGLISALILTHIQRQRIQKEQQSREMLREELHRSEHLASLGLMLAQVAHEVRNPLAGIRSTAQLWQRHPEMSHTPESLEALITAVDRLDELLTRLLTFSRSEMSNRVAFDLNRVVSETFALLRAQALQQNVQIDIHLQPNLPEMIGSPPAIRQILLNISNNSLQAMPHGGRLSCRTEWLPSRKSIRLEIADTGVGIAPNLKSRLFEPFFTTRAQGTGLGLALCRDIIVKHDGTIELDDVKPHGTICQITFPEQRTIERAT